MKQTLIHASFHTAPVVVGSGQALATNIQWMPPGKHTVQASSGGKPVTTTVIVNEQTALVVDRELQDYRAKAERNEEDLPYFDFNHDDIEASARPLRFFWGGDDKVTGGVRAEVEWTEPGKQALLGKAYRRFSPSFYMDAAGVVTGVPVNMGGLVNRAAFKTITPIVAGAAGDETKENIMDAAKLAADLAAAQLKITELEAKLLTSQNTEAIKAKEAQIVGLQTQLAEQKKQIEINAKASAKAIVEAAVKAGKLAPQNTALHAKWVDTIAANPELAETLNAMEPNPALVQVTQPGVTTAPAVVNGEHAFLTKAKAAAQAEKLELSDAIVALAAKEPALYDDYRVKLSATK